MHHAIRGDDGITEKLIGKGGSQILTVKNLHGAMLDGVRVLSITIEGGRNGDSTYDQSRNVECVMKEWGGVLYYDGRED